jgi:hypothetical protein
MQKLRIDLRCQGQRGNGTEARDSGQALADRICFMGGVQPGLERLDLFIEVLNLLSQQRDHVPSFGRNGGILLNSGQQ